MTGTNSDVATAAAAVNDGVHEATTIKDEVNIENGPSRTSGETSAESTDSEKVVGSGYKSSEKPVPKEPSKGDLKDEPTINTEDEKEQPKKIQEDLKDITKDVPKREAKEEAKEEVKEEAKEEANKESLETTRSEKSEELHTKKTSKRLPKPLKGTNDALSADFDPEADDSILEGLRSPTSRQASRSRSRRSASIALSIASTSTNGQSSYAGVFIKQALTAIKDSKDARKIGALETAVSKAIKQLGEDSQSLPTPKTVFEPLKIVCMQTKSNDLKVVALDCIAKLFTFSLLQDTDEELTVDPESGIRPPPSIPLLDQAVTTVCDCYQNEQTDPKVELQIIKALMAAILNEEIIAHGATLLKALRQTYQIFVLSHSNSNQTIAQATLSQMVNVVFERVKNFVVNKKPSSTSSSMNASHSQIDTASMDTKVNPVNSSGPEAEEKLTLKQMEDKRTLMEDERDDYEALEEETENFIKDAFLVFRTMCKLSVKDIEGDGTDLKGHSMRSKLLSLHLVHTVLKSHMSVFLSEDVIVKSNRGDEVLVVAIKDYVCSSLARNAANISPAVFEISAEIFWLILSNLRGKFKRELQVFFTEIYFPIMEMKTSTIHQKQYLLSILQRVCNDPRALVEIYLNYDCDNSASSNIYESIIDILVRIAVPAIHMTQLQLQQYYESRHKPIAVYSLGLPPALAIAQFASRHAETALYPMEYALKITALQSLVAVLRSLIAWSQRGIAAVSASLDGANTSLNGDDSTLHVDESDDVDTASSKSGQPIDDPNEFQSLKQRKTVLSEAIREFNFKPKRGLERLLSEGFIPSREPKDVAEFLATTEGLDKATIGDFLGEDNPFNISVMHEFVDRMDFANTNFVSALRIFLQGFRLPGEGQKIDRFMLKFAERYISGNPNQFTNADTPYILAYSTIMLNTDLHNPQNKKRMTVDEFIANNRGINDKKDLPREFLVSIYEDIQQNEIKLLSEQHAALLSSTTTASSSGFASSFGITLATVGRDLQREAYMQASKEMVNKTESMFKSLILSSKGKDKLSASDSSTSFEKDSGYTFYVASHIEHVKPMFEVCWMSLLAGLTGPFQESDEQEVVATSLEGIRLAVRIACLFDLEYPRISFVSALANFTNLQKLSEMKKKNVEAIKVLLSIALSEGNMLKSSWKDVLVCISQLERVQLISAGIAAGVIPDVTQARIESRHSTESNRSAIGGMFGSFSFSNNSSHRGSFPTPVVYDNFSPEIGEELRSREVIVYMDKIFTQSASLNGSAIQDFVKALIEVAWEEIQSSGQSENPRMFSLQKMVDVCYYNMERIKMEWSQLWSIMGEQYNKICCHPNANVVSFALDALRQLSIRFFDLDELAHFKFQKDFLKPFEYVMKHNPDGAAKDMVLQCLRQMILAKSDRIKSGWGEMFNVFDEAAATHDQEYVVQGAFELVKKIHDEYLDKVIAQDSFGSLITCVGKFAKNPRYQKVSLHAVDTLNETIRLLQAPESTELFKNSAGESVSSDEPGSSEVSDAYNTYWFQVLSTLHDVIMNGVDLEVRSRALNYLFDNLVEHGGKFTPEFWDRVCTDLLFPIFLVLKSHSSTVHQDDMSVWLSTTMIQALRNMIALLTHYFDTLERMLNGFLDLLVMCIDQDNDTVSRIGSSCLLALIIENCHKLSSDDWHLIVDKIEGLFITSTAEELFDSSMLVIQKPAKKDRSSSGSSANMTRPKSSVQQKSDPSDTSLGVHQQLEVNGNGAAVSHKAQFLKFRRAITKSIMQLLMIESMEELFSNDEVFNVMSTNEILRIAECLRQSYLFSKKFNSDKELRMNLWRQGFMKQMPNLHKQETSAAIAYIRVVMKLYRYRDSKSLDADLKKQVIEDQFMSLCVEVLDEYTSLGSSDQRHAQSLGPSVVLILQELSNLTNEDFRASIKKFYDFTVEILRRNITAELREVVRLVLSKVGTAVIDQL